MEEAYRVLKAAWRGMTENAIRAKNSFQLDADECMKFFNGPYDFLYGLSEGPQRGDFLYVGLKRLPRPSICATWNKVAEGVQLFGPSLYFQNPVCKVNPRKAPEIPQQFFGDLNDPMVLQQVAPMIQEIDTQKTTDLIRSILLDGYLNYLPTAMNLKESSRDAIDEAIIKGGGLLWSKMDHPAGGRKMPILEYDTIDNLLIDPDHDSIKEARWVARRFCKPVWEVEAERGLEPGTLKGNYESLQMSSASRATNDIYRKQLGKTNDLLVYWGIWSKMGMGGLLRGISEDAAEADRYGQYVYVEICDSYEYFLNVPEAIWENDEEVRRRVQWETPFWCDVPTSNGWPFTMFAFHKVPRKIWPMSHFRPGMGQLKFINWGYSFLISGIQKRSRDFIAIAKAAGDELKQSILEGDDLTLLELEGNLGGSIDQVVKFLQHPDFQEGIFKVIQAVELSWEKSTGVNELLYGMQKTEPRSAAESTQKANFATIRPDDMASCVEDAMTDAFRKLALMARWHESGQDIALIFGQTIGQLWSAHVESADIEQILHQLEVRIEAGSTRKPNKAKDVDDAKALVTQLFAPLFQFAQATGQVDPVNALIAFMGKAMDVDLTAMLIQPPMTPPPPAPGQPGQEQPQNGQQNGKPQNGKPQPVGR